MPIFRDGGGNAVIQMHPGEIATGGFSSTANSASFKAASPELYWRSFPWMGDELFKLGQPWPFAFFSNDNTTLQGEADDWRIPQNFAVPDVNVIHALVDVTEAGDTLAATAAVAIHATAAITEAGDTLAATAAAIIKATLSATEAGDTLAATAAVAIHATAAITEAGDTLAATATVAIHATAAITEAGDTLVSTVQGSLRATLAVTEDNDAISSTAKVALKAALTKTEADDVLWTIVLNPAFPPTGAVLMTGL